MTIETNGRPRLGAGVLALAGALAASACTLTAEGTPAEGIGFREARFAEISAIRDWRACRDEALDLDRQARKEAAPARYLASAKLLEKCEADLGGEAAKVALDERMRAYALSVQNNLKGGDVPRARENLARFRQAFPDSDLYYADGSSFIDTMEILLGLKDRSALAQFAVLNVGDELKAELRRAHYWKRN